MLKRILSLVLCLVMVAGMIPSVSAYDREFKGESPKSVDQCCHTVRVDTMNLNYVRPAYDGCLIELTPQRVEDTFDYLDEHYVKNHPEQALMVYTGTAEDRENLKKLAETITEGCTTAREKADTIDRWIYQNIYYDINTSAYAYDTFYNRTGNCLSYANLMQFLLRSLGIPAVVGDGWRGDMKTSTVELFNYEGHAWCFVYLEGEWVLYDPLWIECGTTDRDYIAQWIYLDTVEFITPASDGDNLPPEAWDKPKVYYTDGRWYNFDNSHPNGYGNFTMMVNNQSYNFTPCQDELALGLEGGYDGWYILDGKNDKSGMQLGEIYRNSWLSYGEYDIGSYLNLTYAYPNGMQIDGAIMEYDGVERYMQCNTSFPVLAEEEDYTMQYGCLAFKPGYVGPFVAPCWGSLYDTDFYIVTWESDTPEVCTVDENGILTAVAPGFAQVRLTLSDQKGGGYYCITNINVCVSDEERIPQLDSPTASGVCGESLTWELTDDVLTISGTGAMYDYGYMEAPWCDYLANIVQVVAEDGVTRIGNNAFREAVNLTAVSLSDTITEIGSWAFMFAENLTAITLPSNLASLEQQAFLNCYALKEIELPGTLSFIDAGVFSGCTSLTRAVIHAAPDAPSLMMGDGIFRSCTSLEAIEVDEDHFCLKSIDGVLYNYSAEGLSLLQYPCAKGDTVFQIPEGTYDIFQLAMENVDALEELIIPDGIQTIGSYAFQNCDNLRTLRFQGDAPEFGENTLWGMTADIFYPAGNTTWTEEVMQNHGGSITWVPHEEENTVIDSGTCGDDLTWVLSVDGRLTISGMGDMYDYEESPWYAYRRQITSVYIEEGVTSIGEYAFDWCSALTDVSIPDSVTSIRGAAFSSCENLTGVTIPDSVITIDYSAFRYCDSLETVAIGKGVEFISEDAFADCANLSGIYVDAENSFYCSDEKGSLYSADKTLLIQASSGISGDYSIPAGVCEIGSFAFRNCKNLTAVTVPVTVYAVKDFAFGGCPNLTEITFRGDAPALDASVFLGLNATVHYPAGNTTWMTAVLQSYGGTITWKTYHYVPEVLVSGISGNDLTWVLMEDGEFTVSGTGDMYDYPDGPPWELFQSKILRLELGAGVTSIGENAFKSCSNISEVTIHGGITSIGKFAFGGCNFLQKLDLCEGLITIGDSAFTGCISLNTVTIPDSVVSIGSNAFWGCSESYSIEIEEGDSVIIGSVGGNLEAPDGDEGLKEVYIGKGVAYIGPEAFGNCQQLKFIQVDPENAYYCNDDRGVLFNKQKTLLIQAPGAISGHYTIPGSVTAIENWAMSACPDLTGITVHGGVREIGDYAFSAHGSLYFDYETNLREIRFQGDIPEMGMDVFWDIVATAYYPENNPTWTADVMQDYGGSITWVGYTSECTDHDYEAVVTAPTCTKQGYTTYTCSKCGDSYVADYTDPVKHVYEENGPCKWCGTRWVTATTSLNGTIDLNIYVALSQEVLNDPDAFIRFTRGGVNVDIPVSEGIESVRNKITCYRFTCEIFAKQVADTVTIQVMKGDEVIGTPLEYSVMRYCVNQIKNSRDEKLVAVCKSMLNYAAAAQLSFNYNTDNLANASLSEADKVLPEVDASAYKFSVTGSEEGIKARTATLMLESVVKIRVYFQLTGNKSFDDYTFTIDGKEVELQHNSNGYFIETDGIPAKHLEQMHEFSVGGLTVRYGALSYVNSKLTSSTAPESEKNISKALYAYWQAAEAFLGG